MSRRQLAWSVWCLGGVGGLRTTLAQEAAVVGRAQLGRIESEWVAEPNHPIEIRSGWVLRPDVQFLERSGDVTGGSWAFVVGLRTRRVF